MIAQTQHLQRLVDSLGGGNNNNNNNECPQQIITSPSTGTVGAFKKRKLDQVVTVQTISDSSDEGLGSMSPEPVSQMILTNGSSGTITKTHMVSATSVTTINVKDYVNLQNQMETERRHRIQLEEQLRHLEMQVYSNQQATPAVAIAGQKYQIHEETEDVDIQPVGTVIEEKIILRQQPQQQQQQQQPEENSNIHYHVPHHQYVVVSTPGSSPKNIIMNDNDEDSRTLSSDELHKDEVKLVRKMSPKHQPREIRIPSILEKAIKAEPKVEVERISSPVIHINMIEEAAVQSPPRLTGSPTIRTTYPSNNQRPNLETIVEAIRHLEGDAAFDMDDGQEQQQSTKVQTPTTQEAPLALTTNNKYHQTSNNRSGNNIQEHNTQPFLKFRQTSTSQSGLPTFSVSVPSSQQQRPGVIVVKQSS
jgi:transcription factor AP-4